MRLSKRQNEILLGMILGDGHLEKNGKNVRLRVDHSEHQESYLRWKHSEFENFATGSPKMIEESDKRTGKIYKRWHFSTYSIELFNLYRKAFYRNRIKIIPKNICELMRSPLSLAVWYMDDGYKRNDCNALRLNTDFFQIEEQRLLQKCLKDNFGIITRLHKKGKFWNIYIPSSETRIFCRMIKPYIIPELYHKISLTL